MERGSAKRKKRLKSSDDLQVQIREDSVSHRLDHSSDELADESLGDASAYNAERQYGVESNQIRDYGAAKVISTSEGNAMPVVNYSGYVEAPCDNAGNNPSYVVPSGAGLSFGVSPMDERQLKRERRKQANRESARKSRMRKQCEYEELMKSWDSLKSENSALKSEMERLNADSEIIRRENAALMERIEKNEAERNGRKISTNTSDPEKSQDISGNLDQNEQENSNSEAKLHQLLEIESRGDSVVA